MKEYLGLTPPDDAQGVLQDIHWSAGLFGYFATYSLGNLIAAQLWERRQRRPSRPRRPARRRGARAASRVAPRHPLPLRRQALGGGTLKQAIGEEIDPSPLLAQLEAKYGELYNLVNAEGAR